MNHLRVKIIVPGIAILLLGALLHNTETVLAQSNGSCPCPDRVINCAGPQLPFCTEPFSGGRARWECRTVGQRFERRNVTTQCLEKIRVRYCSQLCPRPLCGEINGAPTYCNATILGGATCGTPQPPLTFECPVEEVEPPSRCPIPAGTQPRCGDGCLNWIGEECDDGNRIPFDGCDLSCKRDAACGDGIVESPETCDDGNRTNGDGCSQACRRESTNTPPPPPPPPPNPCSGPNPAPQCRTPMGFCDTPTGRLQCTRNGGFCIPLQGNGTVCQLPQVNCNDRSGTNPEILCQQAASRIVGTGRCIGRGNAQCYATDYLGSQTPPPPQKQQHSSSNNNCTEACLSKFESGKSITSNFRNLVRKECAKRCGESVKPQWQMSSSAPAIFAPPTTKPFIPMSSSAPSYSPPPTTRPYMPMSSSVPAMRPPPSEVVRPSTRPPEEMGSGCVQECAQAARGRGSDSAINYYCKKQCNKPGGWNAPQPAPEPKPQAAPEPQSAPGQFIDTCLSRCLTSLRGQGTSEQLLRVCRAECNQTPIDPPTPRPNPEPWPTPRPEPKPENSNCTPKKCASGEVHATCAADGSPINYFRDPCGALPKPKPEPLPPPIQNGRGSSCYKECASALEQRGSNAQTIEYFCSKRCAQSPEVTPQACWYDLCRNIPVYDPDVQCMAPTVSVSCDARNCNVGPCTNPAPPPPSAPPQSTTPNEFPYGSPLGPVPVVTPHITTSPPEGYQTCEDQPEVIRNASSSFLCKNCLKFGCKISNNNRGIAARACNLTCT